MKIITNNVPREVIEPWHLSESERKEFDYIPWAKVDNGEEYPTFVRYKGELYDLGDFMYVDRHRLPQFEGWHGYISDSFFSGILVKFTKEDGEVIMGRYYA